MPETYYWERLIHSIKTALACLLGLALTIEFGSYRGPWLVISIIVVMCAQINVGSMVQKSSMRLLGTLCGSIIAALCIWFFPSDYYVYSIITAIAVAIFSFFATGQSKLHDAGTLGAVTVAIILIGHDPTMTVAWSRFVEISIGILLAGLISQVLFPVHARTHLRNGQAETLRQLSLFYSATLLNESSEKNESHYIELDEAIVKSLIEQRKLAKDAGRELFGSAFNMGQFNQYLWYAREILRSMTFMHLAYNASAACKNVFSGTKAITDFQQQISRVLTDIASGIENNHMPTILLPSLTPIKNIIAENHTLSEDDQVYCHAFLFCAEILTDNLRQLSKLESI
jgi:uncharacterized membrane protein YccC